jgi:hypothetical protein
LQLFAPSQGLFALPFMQRAMERKRAEAGAAARAALAEIAAEEEAADGGGEVGDPLTLEGGRAGRMSFGQPGKSAKSSGRDDDDDDEDGVGYGAGMASDSEGEGSPTVDKSTEEAAAVEKTPRRVSLGFYDTQIYIIAFLFRMSLHK